MCIKILSNECKKLQVVYVYIYYPFVVRYCLYKDKQK